MAVPAAFQLAKQLRQAPEEDRRRTGRARSARSPASPRWKWPATATSTSASTAAPTAPACCAATPTSRDGSRREDHRRAHQHQSQQGGAHRPPAQRRARRHLRPHAARAAATASRCRTTSTTPACRWPTSWSASTTWKRRRPADVQALLADPAVRFDYYCWDLYARTRRYYKDHPESLPWRSADAARHRSGRGRSRRAGAPGGRRHRAGAPGDHAPPGRRIRRAAARERDPAPEVLGRRRSSCSRSARRSTSRPRARTAGCWVMPGRSPKKAR